MRALATILVVSAFGIAAARATPAEELAICIKAAAATDHVDVKDVDRGGCECATKQLRSSLKPGDFALHERMLEIIASGADQKTGEKQLSDVMLQRGMTQRDADAFFARVNAAQEKAQEICNPSPLLPPQTVPKNGQ